MKRKDQETKYIPVVEEELHVGTREVETGRVRVRKVVREVEEEVEEPLEDSRVEIRRVEVNSMVDEPQTTRQEGNVTIIPIHEEVTVVEKKLLLKEEIHVIRRRVTHDEPTTVVLRKEEAVIEREEVQRENEHHTSRKER